MNNWYLTLFNQKHAGDANVARCDKCRLFIRAYLLDDHIAWRHHTRAIKEGECSKCHYGGTKYEKTAHMKSHNGRGKLPCDLCFVDPFVFQKDLDNHRLKYHCPKER